ncbi:MAG: hypothetical protein GY845_35810 [Planctomycetes bacterium]|nr:hypothetical protein [Planctomycetota bacterium]
MMKPTRYYLDLTRDPRRVFGGMEYLLLGGDGISSHPKWLAGVWIAVETVKVAAGYLNPNS